MSLFKAMKKSMKNNPGLWSTKKTQGYDMRLTNGEIGLFLHRKSVHDSTGWHVKHILLKQSGTDTWHEYDPGPWDRKKYLSLYYNWNEWYGIHLLENSLPSKEAVMEMLKNFVQIAPQVGLTSSNSEVREYVKKLIGDDDPSL